MNDSARVPLRPVERWGIGLLLTLLVLLGILVEKRTAYPDVRRWGISAAMCAAPGPFGAAQKLYDVVDNNNWHYNYPPFFAIMLVPMADPPAEWGPAPFLSFPASVALWFLISLACLAHAIHVLASTIEENSSDRSLRTQPRWCRRWWAMRIAPFIVCLIPIGHTLMRNQVNTVILAMLCSMIAAFSRKRDFQAGLWLALAASIKVIPIYLFVYPLARRNWRALAGGSVGLTLTLVVLPVLVWGPAETVDVYGEFYKTLLGPAFDPESADHSRKKELLGKGLTDNQSLKSAPFNLLNPNIATRPDKVPAWVEWNYRIVGLLLTLITLAVGFRSGLKSDWSQAAVLGAFVFLMCALSPVCHLHYFTYMLPLVMALLARRWEFRNDLVLSPLLCCVLTLMFFANLLPQLPWVELVLRDVGLPLYVGFCIWLLAMRRIWQAAAKREEKFVGQTSSSNIAA